MNERPGCLRSLLLLLFVQGSLLALAAEPPPARGVAGEIALDNELPVSGPQVVLKTTYGVHYHPGAAWALEGRIYWPAEEGATFEGGVTVQEGEGTSSPRYEMRLKPGAPPAFRLPVRAPAGGATLTLSLWREVHGLRQDLFRASLVKVLKVIPRQARVVLKCWPRAPLTALTVPRDWFVAETPGAEMPERDWMYENVDLVVLGQGAFAALSPEALAALRRWVLGGGRLLIAAVDAASQDVLTGAVQAGLTPLPPDTRRTESSFEWWAQQAGLREEDVQRDPRFQMVFARYRLGLGGGILFFPFADPEAVPREGMRALSDPILVRERPGRSDWRVWSRPYDFFAPGALPPRRRYRVALSALIGAACLLAVLAYAAGERRRYMAAGLALGVAALLAALLARGFPAPALVTSAVEFAEVARDGRALVRTEWAFLDGLTEVAGLAVHGPEPGTLGPLHFRERELADAGTEVGAQDGLVYRFRPAFPPPCAPIFQAERIEALDAPASPGLRYADAAGQFSVRLPPGDWGTRLGACFGRVPELAVLVRRDGSKWLLSQASAEAFGAFHAAPFRGEKELIRVIAPDLPAAEMAARAEALEYALECVAAKGGERLVVCGAARGAAALEDRLIRTSGVTEEQGPRFAAWMLEVRVEEPGREAR